MNIEVVFSFGYNTFTADAMPPVIVCGVVVAMVTVVTKRRTICVYRNVMIGVLMFGVVVLKSKQNV